MGGLRGFSRSVWGSIGKGGAAVFGGFPSVFAVFGNIPIVDSGIGE